MKSDVEVSAAATADVPFADETAVDPTALSALGTDVVEAMQSLRGLLESRAEAIETCRISLVEHHERLISETRALETQETELCDRLESRENKVGQREKQCDETDRQLDDRQSSFENDMAALAKRRGELEAARASLDAEKSQLAESLDSLREREDRLAEERAAVEKMSRNREDQEGVLAARCREVEEQAAQLEQMRASQDSREADLAAQEAAYAAQRAAFEEDRGALATERDAVARERADREQREAEMSALCNTLQQKSQELEKREAALASTQAELTALRLQLEQELRKVTDARDELLGTYGLTTEAAQGGGRADANVPNAAELEARKSIGRFQKLCRDAKRRAVGA